MLGWYANLGIPRDGDTLPNWKVNFLVPAPMVSTPPSRPPMHEGDALNHPGLNVSQVDAVAAAF